MGPEVKAAVNISDEIIQMIEKQKPVSVPVRDTTNLYMDLGFNSFSFIGFLLKIEETYSITFNIEEMETCLQVDRLIALVENKVKGHDKNND